MIEAVEGIMVDDADDIIADRDKELEDTLDKLKEIIEDLQSVAANLFDYGDIDFANGLDALAIGLTIKMEKRFPNR